MDDGGGEVDHRLETAVCLVASHCYALEFLQLAEEVLDQVAPFVNVLVDVERLALRSFMSSMIQLESKALSAIKPPNSRSLIRGATPTVSKRWPGSRMNRTRFPSASVSARILVVQPPFDLPMA